MESGKVMENYFGQMDHIMKANLRIIKCTDTESNMAPMEKSNTEDNGSRIIEKMVKTPKLNSGVKIFYTLIVYYVH